MNLDLAREGVAPVTARTYEIVFAGEAVPAIVEAFDGYEVTGGRGYTTVRAEHIGALGCGVVVGRCLGSSSAQRHAILPVALERTDTGTWREPLLRACADELGGPALEEFQAAEKA